MQDIKRPSHNLKFNSLKGTTSRRNSSNFDSSYAGDYFDIDSKKNDKTINEKLDAFEKRVSDYYTDKNFNLKKDHKFSKARQKTKAIFYLFIFVILTAFVYLTLTYVLNSAKVTVVPKKVLVNLDKSIVVNLSDKGVKVLENSGEEESVLPKSELKKVISKSRGTITVYNNFNSSKQKLIKNTRFKTADGKLFRLLDSIVVPGMTGITPGKIEANVIADDIGEEFNIGPSKFTIPGFEGTSRYNGFYAVSEGYMIGGANGDKYVVAKEDIENVNKIKENIIKDKTLKQIFTTIDENYVLATETAMYDFENNLTDYEYNREDKYKIKGNLHVISFDKEYLAKKIAEVGLDNYSGEKLKLLNSDKLNITLSKNILESGIKNFKDVKDISISIKGEASLVYVLPDSIIKDLLTNSENNKDSFSKILNKLNNVDSATAKVFPPWSNYYPSNREKITIIFDYK